MSITKSNQIDHGGTPLDQALTNIETAIGGISEYEHPPTHATTMLTHNAVALSTVLDGVFVGTNRRCSIGLSSPNLNVTPVKSGFYYCGSPTNQPPGVGNGYLLHQQYDLADNICTQTYSVFNTGRIFNRENVHGTWSNWIEVQRYDSVSKVVANPLSLQYPGTYRITNATLDLPYGITVGDNDLWVEVDGISESVSWRKYTLKNVRNNRVWTRSLVNSVWDPSWKEQSSYSGDSQVIADPLTISTPGTIRITNATTNLPLGITSGNNDLWVQIDTITESTNWRRITLKDIRTNRSWSRSLVNNVWDGSWSEDIRARGSITGNDLNNLRDCGFYHGSSLTNAPSGNFMYIEVQEYASSPYVLQKATLLSMNNVMHFNRTWTRVCENGNWTAWREDIKHLGANTISANLNDYLLPCQVGLNAANITSGNPRADMGYYILEVVTYGVSVGGAEGCLQRATSISLSGLQYERTFDGGSYWSPWRKIPHTEELWVVIPTTGWGAAVGVPGQALYLNIPIATVTANDRADYFVQSHQASILQDAELAQFTTTYAGGIQIYAQSVPLSATSVKFVIERG